MVFLWGLGWGQWLQHGRVVGNMTRTSVVANEFWWWMKGLLLIQCSHPLVALFCSMLGLLALSWCVLVGEGLGVLVLEGSDEKRRTKGVFPRSSKKKQPEKASLLRLVFNLSRPDARLQSQHSHPTARTDAITRTGMGALSEAVESGLPTGEGPSRTPADSRKYCLGFFRVLWSFFGDPDVYRLVGGR